MTFVIALLISAIITFFLYYSYIFYSDEVNPLIVFIAIFIFSISLINGCRDTDSRVKSSTISRYSNDNDLKAEIDQMEMRIKEIDRELDSRYSGPFNDDAIKGDILYRSELENEQFKLTKELYKKVKQYNR
jgi:hypothetical protein